MEKRIGNNGEVKKDVSPMEHKEPYDAAKGYHITAVFLYTTETLDVGYEEFVDKN